MKRAAGAVILGLLVLVALLGPVIAPYGINEQERSIFAPDAEGNVVRVPPPHPLSWKHPLGTDRWGYDVLTRMLYGARYTLGFIVGVAAVRIVLGFLVASAAHLWSHARRRWHPHAAHHPIGTAIPEFVVAYIALAGIAFSPPMATLPFALLQGVIISIIGLPGLVPTLRARMERAAAQPFVEAQIASGAGAWHIYTHTVVPSVVHDLWLLLSHEALLVALVVGELAIFHVFVGGTIRTFDPVEHYSRSHEWVGMVGENSGEILGGIYRLILIPLAGYLIVVVALALLSEGSRTPVVRHRSGSPLQRLVSMFMRRGGHHAQGR